MSDQDKQPTGGDHGTKESTEPAASAGDEDLSALLDSALQDFGKAKPAEEGAASTATGGSILNHPDFDPMMGFMDQAAAQKAAQDFQTMLSQLAQVQKNVFEQLQTHDGAASTTATLDPSQMPMPQMEGEFPAEMFSPEQAQAILQSITSLADRASKVAQAPDEDTFMKEMQNLQSEDDSQFMPFMAGLMASFLSKEMMYPPVKEMVDKYPKYLEENKAKLDSDTLARYDKQLEIMHKICHEYENEADEKDQEACMRQFDTITQLMQQMQMCGYPPEELVGNLPPGWSFDTSTGMPKLEDAKQASESCCVM